MFIRGVEDVAPYDYVILNFLNLSNLGLFMDFVAFAILQEINITDLADLDRASRNTGASNEFNIDLIAFDLVLDSHNTIATAFEELVTIASLDQKLAASDAANAAFGILLNLDFDILGVQKSVTYDPTVYTRGFCFNIFLCMKCTRNVKLSAFEIALTARTT